MRLDGILTMSTRKWRLSSAIFDYTFRAEFESVDIMLERIEGNVNEN